MAADEDKRERIPFDAASDAVVDVDNVSVHYKLYSEPKYRLREAMHPFGKQYHKPFSALRNVSVQVLPGEILGIVGRNGSGKSTLLKVMAGVLAPSEGRITVRGSVSALLELGAGFNPEFSGMENVYFLGSIMDFSKEEMKDKVDEILDFADIGEHINQPLKTYSSGMKARLAFAISTCVNPEILMLDEVLSVGDVLFQRKCFARMESFLKSGRTILFVSHSSAAIVELCTRAILLEKGTVIMQDTPRDVIAEYERMLFAKVPVASHNQRGETQAVKAREERKPRRGGPLPEEVKADAAYNNPAFVTQSLMEYRNRDVRIEDPHLETPSGQRVNNIVLGDEYNFVYTVRFNEEARNVYAGFGFKNTRGMVIAGVTAPGKNEYLEKVHAGDAYRMICRFRCTLLPGTYFVNAGVLSLENDDKTFLCRVIDGYCFNVLPKPQLASWGLVSLEQNCTLEKA